jgi:RNA polymerase sigma-70 factor (ECF subfamily)
METPALSTAPIEQLYQDYHQPIIRYLERLVHQHETAEDLSQETFIKAMRHREQLDQVASVRHWLYRIATNTAYDYLRRQQRVAWSSLSSDESKLADIPAPERHWDDDEPILTALHHIPDHYRIPLLLYEYAGYDLKDIATAMGINVNTVKTRVHRGRTRFRQVYVA